eukprot:Gregarina_sp_Poly_1__482@NODE_1116_length_5039_cov_67_501810_g773_i0_p2_GENE_NODE_1116_length_5039_cov_67_501810_g773_i0NODE_1116_length_5039_cov_67_501810_g773_i0_p2_ORF_typecomplete_len444_score58_47Fbox/PF00646_33/1_8e05Fboxlike/PF12937_7/0_2_NODE_1116_length_5039_cov_67_501810_g773_i029814312
MHHLASPWDIPTVSVQMPAPCISHLSPELLIHCLTFLDTKQLSKCASLSHAFRLLIWGDRDGSQNKSCNLLWSALLEREELRWSQSRSLPLPSPRVSVTPLDIYRSHNASFYLLELSVPKLRQTFYVLQDPSRLAEVLSTELTGLSSEGRHCMPDRTTVQQLLRTGLEVCLYTVYRGRLLSVTPLYDFFSLRVGDDCLLQMHYLGGIADESRDEMASQFMTAAWGSRETSSLESNRGRRVAVADIRGPVSSASDDNDETVSVRFGDELICNEAGWRKRYLFFREGRRCRYQLTEWISANAAQDNCQHPSSGGSFCVTCPSSLLCDVIVLPLAAQFTFPEALPELEPSGFRLSSDAQDIPLWFEPNPVPKNVKPPGTFVLRTCRSTPASSRSLSPLTERPSPCPEPSIEWPSPAAISLRLGRNEMLSSAAGFASHGISEIIIIN